MWQSVIFILCVIHYAQSATNPPCPKIKQTGQCLGLPKTDKCQTDGACGLYKMCCPKECGKECTSKRKSGICPTFTEKPLSFCSVARIASECDGNDDDCSGTKKCCPDICGSRKCKEPAPKDRPECPSFPKNVPCLVYQHDCSHEKECPQGKICCGVTCGIGCAESVQPNLPKSRQGVCPPFPKDDPNFCNLVDVRYDCDVDSDCTERNKKCCGTPCGGRACTNPLKGDRTGCPMCSSNQPSTGCSACIQYQQLCNSDKECNREHLCCFNPSCGTSCKRKYGR
ncbi:WAP four-disulfide core domain protein 3-like isoform X1 [Mytilus californianus]|uniref:WAP four-disulfide core domain protein 3-like isoform X1 n=1 Tax=Mytilus californianus TaxID=6549 RepID=UPI002245D128|nr:WAP four-disulfide core domain protein 3-like isoform X1 [Mytilus californianus]